MLDILQDGQFIRDIKLLQKRRLKLSLLWDVVEMIKNSEELPIKYKNHKLSGKLKDYWECHISPDWLLIYKIEGNTLFLARTGTHADLLNM